MPAGSACWSDVDRNPVENGRARQRVEETAVEQLVEVGAGSTGGDREPGAVPVEQLDLEALSEMGRRGNRVVMALAYSIILELSSPRGLAATAEPDL